MNATLPARFTLLASMHQQELMLDAAALRARACDAASV